MGARGGQEGGLATMSQLGLNPSVHGGGEDCEEGEGWWCDAIRNGIWCSGSLV